jgi:carboxylesterase type B
MARTSLVFVSTLLIAAALAAEPIVTTPYGKVSGTVDQGVYAFRGIPFAAPPVGSLRFQKTAEVSAWSGVINGSTFAPGCVAVCSDTAFPVPGLMCTPTTSEDCLYLNVYTPNLESTANLPVLIFIHGGNYIGGSGGVPLYDGGDLARTQNIVVVTINYRLGVFGALYTGTVKGNFHLTDQRESMKFVQKVISNFGGNPNKVTISGQSAGAFSVATHLASPKSWPYFQGAVIFSDPFALLAETPERAITVGEKLLTNLNCSENGGQSELQCLQSFSAEELLWQQVNGSVNFNAITNGFLSVMMPWVPVVDGDELPYHPLVALTTDRFNKVPVMFGTVANESVEFIYDIERAPLNAFETDLLLSLVFGEQNMKAIVDLYGAPPASGDCHHYIEIIATDYIFYCPNRFVGSQLTKTTPTYMYFFDQLASYSGWVYNKSMPYCTDAICHADDLPFYFNPFNAPLPPGLHPPQPTAEELVLTATMQKALANFVAGGNPNPLPNVEWPRFNGSVNALMNYSTPATSILTGYRDVYCNFWDSIGYNRY